MLNRQSSNNNSSPSHLPPRDIKSFLSRGVINKMNVQNRMALLREQREILKTEVAALQQRNRMLDMQQQEPSLKQQHQHQFLAYEQQHQQQQPNNNAVGFMEAASLLSSQQPNHANQNKSRRFVDAIDAAFASERNPSNDSLSLLASALSKNQHSNDNINNAINDKNMMLHQDDMRMRAAATKSMFPQSRFEETQLQKLLRARYN